MTEASISRAKPDQALFLVFEEIHAAYLPGMH